MLKIIHCLFRTPPLILKIDFELSLGTRGRTTFPDFHTDRWICHPDQCLDAVDEESLSAVQYLEKT